MTQKTYYSMFYYYFMLLNIEQDNNIKVIIYVIEG